MTTSDYHFVTVWRVPARSPRSRPCSATAATLPRWWPSVYLEVVPRVDGDADRLGSVIDLHTTGWLPYTLRWALTITEPITDPASRCRRPAI